MRGNALPLNVSLQVVSLLQCVWQLVFGCPFLCICSRTVKFALVFLRVPLGKSVLRAFALACCLFGVFPYGAGALVKYKLRTGD